MKTTEEMIAKMQGTNEELMLLIYNDIIQGEDNIRSITNMIISNKKKIQKLELQLINELLNKNREI